jgi:hypothetical protein
LFNIEEASMAVDPLSQNAPRDKWRAAHMIFLDLTVAYENKKPKADNLRSIRGICGEHRHATTRGDNFEPQCSQLRIKRGIAEMRRREQ